MRFVILNENKLPDMSFTELVTESVIATAVRMSCSEPAPPVLQPVDLHIFVIVTVLID